MSSSNHVFERVPSICRFEHESSNRTFGRISSNCMFEPVPSNCVFGRESSNRAFGRVSSNHVFECVPLNCMFGCESSNHTFRRVPSNCVFGCKSSNRMFKHVQSPSNHVFRSVASSFSPLSSVLLQDLLVLPKKFDERIFDLQVIWQGIGWITLPRWPRKKLLHPRWVQGAMI